MDLDGKMGQYFLSLVLKEGCDLWVTYRCFCKMHTSLVVFWPVFLCFATECLYVWLILAGGDHGTHPQHRGGTEMLSGGLVRQGFVGKATTRGAVAKMFFIVYPYYQDYYTPAALK